MHVLVLVLSARPIVRSIKDCRTVSHRHWKGGGVHEIHIQRPLVRLSAFACAPETGDGCTIWTGACGGIGAVPAPKASTRAWSTTLWSSELFIPLSAGWVGSAGAPSSSSPAVLWRAFTFFVVESDSRRCSS